MFEKHGLRNFPDLKVAPALIGALAAGFLAGVVLARRGYRRIAEDARRQTAEDAAMELSRLRAEKREAVEKLARGVAHDFNNYLTAILGYSELFLEMAPGDDPRRYEVEAIRKSAEEASAFTRELIAVSRRQMVEAEPVDIHEFLTLNGKPLLDLVGDNIQLKMSLNDQAGFVKADRLCLWHAITNLMINARDSLPGCGCIAIRTGNAVFNEPNIPFRCDLNPGSYVVVSITLEGHGIDAVDPAHIFEPYVLSKKGGGRGGLTLAAAYGIIRQMDGDIEVRGEAGKSATFDIFLPRLENVEFTHAGPCAWKSGKECEGPAD